MTNGTLLDIQPVAHPASVARMMQRSMSATEFENYRSVQMYAITYASDGLRIRGFLALPPAQPNGVYPAIVFNRGGTGERGALSVEGAFVYAGVYASWGYVTIASNYRGHGGSEGIEEWGGRDVDDAAHLLPVLRSLGYVDMDRVGIVGGSRGGMMALMMLRTMKDFRAAATIGAPTILHKTDIHAYIRKTFAKFILPEADIEQEAVRRSATSWADEICKLTPLLVLHGTGDRRVLPDHAFSLGMELQKYLHPYRLTMYENADHILAGRREESNLDIRWWMDTFVKNKSPLPKVGPHGA